MPGFGWILPALVAAPALMALAALLLKGPRLLLRFGAAGTALLAVPALAAAWAAFHAGSISCAAGWFRLDALSAYHLAVMMAVFTLCSTFSIVYFREEIDRGEFTHRMARRYVSLVFGSLAAMMLVLVSNNLAIMWVGIEATTLLTAFLICIHMTPSAIEAMWKYLVMCSVGVAVAFAGILLVAAAAAPANLSGPEVLFWTTLMRPDIHLSPVVMKVAFIFLVVGFGTKAGLAPLHSWLPDAHSQAPAPVSAIFSGFLLNAALYCILRYIPLVENATGNTGWAGGILVFLGVLSVLIAAAFIVAQRDIKRMLAYSSVENIGIIAIGVGLGGLGTVAALLHTLNNSLCKSLAFFCAGRVGQQYGTLEMRKIRGAVSASPLWGTALLVTLLALVGSAPFALFLSEFMIVRAAWTTQSYWVLGFFLFGLAAVFVGILRHTIAMAWDPAETPVKPLAHHPAERLIILVPLALLLILGFWIPAPLMTALHRAAEVLGGVP